MDFIDEDNIIDRFLHLIIPIMHYILNNEAGLTIWQQNKVLLYNMNHYFIFTILEASIELFFGENLYYAK